MKILASIITDNINNKSKNKLIEQDIFFDK